MGADSTMEPPESFDALERRLIEIEPHLPKRLRQAAAFALAHPDDFALGTASALARSAEVQASTLVRFAQTLGFAGFSELQEVFRARLRNRWPDYSERLKALHENARDSGDPTHLLIGFADSAAASIARLRQSLGLCGMTRTKRCPQASDQRTFTWRALVSTVGVMPCVAKIASASFTWSRARGFMARPSSPRPS